ncbi:glycogen/starch synthase [Desulfosarcina widdelii]|uniref:glycogen/starch synthase n=1 Tax=Desulfosarcina widdelii TaxID=947919 RepID=UPI0012D33DFB|nr:glycogen/starch synthase [Desulfosarcina widdelii]
MLTTYKQHPRILVVTPEVGFVHNENGLLPHFISDRACGLGNICIACVHALFERGVDVHLAIPKYIYDDEFVSYNQPDLDIYHRQHQLPESNVHLAQDRSFHYHSRLFINDDWDSVRVALAFQREVIKHIIPRVQPDLIHCYDWTTGLIPAVARRNGIPCLFTLYHTESAKVLLSTIEDQGLNIKSFWEYCFFSRMPDNYAESKDTNFLDLLASGIFSASQVNTLSQTYQDALVEDGGLHASPILKSVLKQRLREGKLSALAPAPNTSFNPTTDRALFQPYGPSTHATKKAFNKLHLQEILNLNMDSTVPVFFWPSRLDGKQPECRLIAETLSMILERYRKQCLQIVFIAGGDFHDHLRAVVAQLQATDCVAVSNFDVYLYRLAYGGADFLLMPSYFTPCALPCMIGQLYGTLSIAYDAGAIHDCVQHLDVKANNGTGFLFKHFNANGFLWAIDQAMAFYKLSDDLRILQIQRIMKSAMQRFVFEDSVRQIIDLYMKTLNCSPKTWNA